MCSGGKRKEKGRRKTREQAIAVNDAIQRACDGE